MSCDNHMTDMDFTVTVVVIVVAMFHYLTPALLMRSSWVVWSRRRYGHITLPPSHPHMPPTLTTFTLAHASQTHTVTLSHASPSSHCHHPHTLTLSHTSHPHSMTPTSTCWTSILWLCGPSTPCPAHTTRSVVTASLLTTPTSGSGRGHEARSQPALYCVHVPTFHLIFYSAWTTCMYIIMYVHVYRRMCFCVVKCIGLHEL